MTTPRLYQQEFRTEDCDETQRVISMRSDERSGWPTWAQVEELETKIERLETELLEAEGIIEEVCGETEMKPNDDGTKNGAKSPKPACESVMRRDAVEYGAALDEIQEHLIYSADKAEIRLRRLERTGNSDWEGHARMAKDTLDDIHDTLKTVGK